MDFHKEIFKETNVMSPSNRKEMTRKLQRASRAEKRNILHQKARSIPKSPKFSEFEIKAASCSTPMKRNQIGATVNKENLNDEIKKAETKANNFNKFKEYKNARRLEYIQRFINWKADKLKEKEEKIQNPKKPFVLVGKVKENLTQTAQPPSFAPPNHVFRAPKGLKYPTAETEKEDSIYLPVPTPPKRNEINKNIAPKTEKCDYKANAAKEIMVRRKQNFATKTLLALKQKEGNKAVINIINTVPGYVENTEKAVGITESNQDSVATENGIQCLNAVGNAESNNHNFANQNEIKTLKKTFESTKTSMPNVMAKKKIITKEQPIRQIDKTKEQNNINLQSSNKKPLGVIIRTRRMQQNRNEDRNPADENSRKYPKPRLAINGVRTAESSKDKATKEIVTHPIKTVSKQYTNKTNAVKENETRPQNEAFRLGKNPVPEEKDKNINIKEQRICRNNKIIEQKNDKPVGAISKARTMQQMRKNVFSSKEENEKKYPKPKLATNLKAKMPLRSNKTIVENKTNPNKIKKDMLTTKQRNVKKAPLGNENARSVLAKFPSSTNSLTTQDPKSVESTSSLPESAGVSKTRKFNFVREVLLDLTIDSPEIIPITERKATNELTTSDQKELSSSELEEMKKTQLKKGKKEETKSVFNSSAALKISSGILQKLHLMNPQKVKQLQSPLKPKFTPKKSLDLESKRKLREIRSLNSTLRTEQNEVPLMNGLHETNTEATSNPQATPEKISSNEEEILITPKQDENNPNRPTNYLSPFVSVSRGKVSAKKEKEKRNSIYLQESPANDVSGIKPIETSVEYRRAVEAIRHFRQQLENETKRLHAHCDEWDAYKDEHIELLKENGGEDMINVTCGQTRLLTSKKFMQFNSLIDRCENHANGTAPLNDGSEKTKPITPDDLEGFWSMLGLQVENIDKRFQNLERWKSNNWDDPDEIKPKTRKVKKMKTTTKNSATKPRANTALREMMLKKKAEMLAKNGQEEEQKTETLIKEATPTSSPYIQRRSTQYERIKNNNNSSGRICIVVPDRRSFSLARTVISVPSPLYNSPLLNHQNSVNRNARRSRGRCFSLITPNVPSPESCIKTDTFNSPVPNSSISGNLTEQNRKSILKTPGTTKLRSRSVVFNNHLSVKKFRCLNFDENYQSTEYSAVEQVHIDDFVKMKMAPDLSSPSEKTDDENDRVYRLRNRKIKLRPSCEIVIPQC